MRNIRTFDLVDYVKAHKHATMNELKEVFGLSSSTLYRDVAELVRRNVFQRLHGGVAFTDNSQRTMSGGVASDSYAERADVNRAAKETIAQKALTYIEEGDIIFLDSSTTVAALADALTATNFTNLTIVTNSVAALRAFPRFPRHYVLLSLGGAYDAQLNAFMGSAALRELDRLTITKAFVSCFGINEHIATTNHENQAALVVHVLDKAEKKYLLADHSKNGRTGLYRISARGAFDAILSEA